MQHSEGCSDPSWQTGNSRRAGVTKLVGCSTPKCILCLHAEVSGEKMAATLAGKQSGEKCSNENRSWGQMHRGQANRAGNEQRSRAGEPVHTRATQAQIEAAPLGTLAHRNYACEALKDERAKHAPDGMVRKAKNIAAGNLVFERALHPSIAHTDPPHPHRPRLPSSGTCSRQEAPS